MWFGNNCKFHEGGTSDDKEPDDCSLACVLAESKLDEVCKGLDSGEITVSDLEMVISQKEQLKRLCAASKEFPVQGIDVDAILKNREEELRKLKYQQNCLMNLCTALPSGIKGTVLMLM